MKPFQATIFFIIASTGQKEKKGLTSICQVNEWHTFNLSHGSCNNNLSKHHRSFRGKSPTNFSPQTQKNGLMLAVIWLPSHVSAIYLLLRRSKHSPVKNSDKVNIHISAPKRDWQQRKTPHISHPLYSKIYLLHCSWFLRK